MSCLEEEVRKVGQKDPATAWKMRHNMLLHEMKGLLEAFEQFELPGTTMAMKNIVHQEEEFRKFMEEIKCDTPTT